ncbi:MAG: DNA repair protein RadB, partial [Archaeoglobales archaeon]
MKISTGSRCLDNLLEGGVETGTVTQIFGASGTGKTSICLMIANSAVNQGYKVAYIDTEGLSPERVNQIFVRENLKGIYIYDVVD